MVDSQGQSIDEILERARRRLHRLDPAAAQSAMRDGAILVDTRPQAQRQAQGSVPGALLVERNVLEWRFDPRSDARLPEATGYDVPLIIMCSEGYSSSLAAASLQDLGLRNATDLVGGFVAWAKAGLPVQAVEAAPCGPERTGHRPAQSI
jgi:rhodanese-related sulfurtransferase